MPRLDSFPPLPEPDRRRIYLLRHADVTYFDRTGQPVDVDAVPISQVGQQQAQAMAMALAPAPLDRVMISPLVRCRQTAEIVLDQRELAIETRDDLREIAPGPLDHLSDEWLPDAFVKAFGGDLSPERRFLGGETFASLLERVGRCVEEIRRDDRWRHLLIVAHGGTNRAILTAALGSGLKGFGQIEQDPVCLNLIDIDRHGVQLVRLLNFTPYNAIKEGLHLTTMERLFLEYVQRHQST